MGLFSTSISLGAGVKISQEEFHRLQAFIHEFLGISIPERRRYLLENRLGPRLEDLGLASFSEYIDFLQSGPEAAGERERLAEKVTTNETSFFRDLEQLALFRDQLLIPHLKERERMETRTLNIWSAGCSSGEEPYTLAIMLADVLGPKLKQWSITITGTDISSAVLSHARKGCYSRHALRSTPGEYVERYFHNDGPRFCLAPEVKGLVRFSRVNLRDASAMRTVPLSDYIFCRNVIIYFDADMKRELVGAFHDNLHPHGALLLGYSETLHGITDMLMPQEGIASPVYVKPGRVIRKRPGLFRRRGE